ncbi:hypothetical protein MHYP_G00050850 [Metynnis hypsauchen]
MSRGVEGRPLRFSLPIAVWMSSSVKKEICRSLWSKLACKMTQRETRTVMQMGNADMAVNRLSSYHIKLLRSTISLLIFKIELMGPQRLQKAVPGLHPGWVEGSGRRPCCSGGVPLLLPSQPGAL